MQATDVGATLSVPSNITLAGTDTVTLTVVDPNGVRSSLAMTVGTTVLNDSNGNQVAAANFWAYRVTLATDFPKAGTYSCQLVADFGSGTQNFASAPFNLFVGPRL